MSAAKAAPKNSLHIVVPPAVIAGSSPRLSGLDLT
jgi:hypothetical protein